MPTTTDMPKAIEAGGLSSALSILRNQYFRLVTHLPFAPSKISLAPDVYCVPIKGPLERPLGLMLSGLSYVHSVAP
jgi:hypothetical protein